MLLSAKSPYIYQLCKTRFHVENSPGAEDLFRIRGQFPISVHLQKTSGNAVYFLTTFDGKKPALSALRPTISSGEQP
jgi:hypothetical protein